MRRAGPRRLTCGSESISAPLHFREETSDNFQHGCGGHLFELPPELGAFGARIAVSARTILLDREGNQFAEGPT